MPVVIMQLEIKNRDIKLPLFENLSQVVNKDTFYGIPLSKKEQKNKDILRIFMTFLQTSSGGYRMKYFGTFVATSK